MDSVWAALVVWDVCFRAFCVMCCKTSYISLVLLCFHFSCLFACFCLFPFFSEMRLKIHPEIQLSSMTIVLLNSKPVIQLRCWLQLMKRRYVFLITSVTPAQLQSILSFFSFCPQGASILLMLHYYLGNEVFRDGLKVRFQCVLFIFHSLSPFPVWILKTII